MDSLLIICECVFSLCQDLVDGDFLGRLFSEIVCYMLRNYTVFQYEFIAVNGQTATSAFCKVE